jgi:hypothetical protein
MSTVSRGFKGRRRPSVELPPGQYLVEDFPVLSAGPTPSIDLADWEFVITSETGEQRRCDWDGFRNTASPSSPTIAASRRPSTRRPRTAAAARARQAVSSSASARHRRASAEGRPAQTSRASLVATPKLDES